MKTKTMTDSYLKTWWQYRFWIILGTLLVGAINSFSILKTATIIPDRASFEIQINPPLQAIRSIDLPHFMNMITSGDLFEKALHTERFQNTMSQVNPMIGSKIIEFTPKFYYPLPTGRNLITLRIDTIDSSISIQDMKKFAIDSLNAFYSPTFQESGKIAKEAVAILGEVKKYSKPFDPTIGLKIKYWETFSEKQGKFKLLEDPIFPQHSKLITPAPKARTKSLVLAVSFVSSFSGILALILVFHFFRTNKDSLLKLKKK